MTQRNQADIPSSSISQPVRTTSADFFKRILRESGIKLASNDDPNVLTQEQALVVRDINKLLQNEESHSSVDVFVRGFKVLIRKEKYMKKALLPTLFKKTGGDERADNLQVQQESLFRIFLKVNRLQPHIVDLLLDELTKTIAEESPDVSHLRLVLSQLRYLPYISDAECLATKLVDVIDVASYPSQLEILDSIPDILPDSEYDQTAKQLAKLLDTDNLSAAIVDCLNALSLSPEIRSQIQDHVLARLLTGSSAQTFPVFVDFLLGDVTARSLPGTLLKIRNALHALMGRNDDDSTNKVLIFGRIRRAATSKIVSDAWLGVICAIKAHTDHKPVDLLLLFMLHACNKVKKRSVESTMRKRVKDGYFRPALVDQLFDDYFPQQLSRDYFSSVVEIISSLFRTSAETGVAEFTATLLRRLYAHEHTDRTSRQEILENAIVLIGSGHQKNTTVILATILDLVQEIGTNPNHTVILMRLLEQLDNLDLRSVKLAFEILCALSCAHESLRGVKEEIHMVIRKNLSSSKRSFKHRGIIAAVVLAKHLATTSDDQDSVELSENSFLTVAQLPGGAREAAALLELANSATGGFPELLGLYYDELATILIKPENFNKHFLAWLFESVTNDFQNVFVTENICESINDLHMSIQYNINTEEEIDAPLAVNIAELTLKPHKQSILILAPHFRLLRLLHYKQQNGDLSSIDALLGCGVILPRLENKEIMGADQLKQVSDCLFHCINWFREVISGFVVQKNTRLRRKVVQRLDDLLRLEKVLGECLEAIPEHRLPTSYYFNSSGTSNKSPTKEPRMKQPRKKFKSRETVDDSTTSSVSRTFKRTMSDPSTLRFREIDTDLVRLLKYPLESEQSTDRIVLSISQLNFIVREFTTKLGLLRSDSSSTLGVVDPVQLVQDCVSIVVNLNAHLNVITAKVGESEDFARGFGLIVECLCLIFGWSGFHHVKRLDLLRDILRSLTPDSSTLSANRMICDFIERLAGYAVHCHDSTQAVHLVKTMEALNAITPTPGARATIARTAGTLLNERWDPAPVSTSVESLVKSYLSGANVKTLCGLVGTLQEQAASLKRKSDTLDLLKSITKSNFSILYRNVMGCLYDRVKTETQSLTNAQHLVLWRATGLTMQGLMTVAKIQETKAILVCFLKKTIAILKMFLTHGVPILEIELKSKPDQVVEIFKTMQSTTRFLHHLCCYSKVTKDASLMTHVPQFRLILESLVYRVKAALVANDCSEAFWMGNLKNRDLQGEDILTQTTDNSEMDRDDEDEECAASDDSDISDDDRRKSGSEVFE